MILRDHVTGEKPPNPITGDRRVKPDKGSIDNCWRRDICWKVVDEKLPDPLRVLRRKPMPYDWGLKGSESWFRHETWKSKGRSLDEGWLKVTCSHVQCGWGCQIWIYPNLSKNTIKIKRSSVFFSSFVSAVGWLSSLLFERLRWLDCQSSRWWCCIDNRRSRGWLIRMIFVERADELFEVLDRWSWLPGILFFWISFPWDQIVKTW